MRKNEENFQQKIQKKNPKMKIFKNKKTWKKKLEKIKTKKGNIFFFRKQSCKFLKKLSKGFTHWFCFFRFKCLITKIRRKFSQKISNFHHRFSHEKKLKISS